MLFQLYPQPHRERLQQLAESQEWSELLADGTALDRAKAAKTSPPAAPGQLAGATQFLVERNGPRVRALLRDGVADPEALLAALADWPAALAGSEPCPILFLGLVLTLDCSFAPRCLYCNQIWVARRLALEDWKRLIAEAAKPTPPYVYLTGGEPLLLGEDVWGDEGLVAFGTRLGCAVNINTNAALITPQVALQLAKLGTAKLHISVDAADPQVQGELFQGQERVDAVWRGILNVQIARELLSANHPQIHINCVLTRLNLFGFPQFLRCLLGLRRTRSYAAGDGLKDDPLSPDLAFHLIPVGGGDNAPLRPTASEWKRFYTETWAEAEEVWREYQAAAAVPEKDRKTLADHVPFANPFRRVDHRISLDEYCERAAQGNYWQSALGKRCHVAPSQAFILPDGAQHWCGAHAIRRPPPLGSVLDTGLRENIRRNLDRLAELPIDSCSGCAGATCVINQSMETRLRAQIVEWIKEAQKSEKVGA